MIILFTSHASAQEVSKSAWITQMSNLLPAYTCQDNQYFRVCFNLEAATCNQTMTRLTKSCINQYASQIPDPLVQPVDGTKWGTTVGACAGGLYDIEHSAEKINSELCNNAEKLAVIAKILVIRSNRFANRTRTTG